MSRCTGSRNKGFNKFLSWIFFRKCSKLSNWAHPPHGASLQCVYESWMTILTYKMRDNRPQIHQLWFISVVFCFTNYFYICACYFTYAMFWRVWTFQLVHIQRLTPKLPLTMFVDLGLQPKRQKVKLHESLSVYKADLHFPTWPLFYTFFFNGRPLYSKFCWAAWSTTSLRIISPRW